MRVGKFIGELREDLRRKIELTPNLTYSLACSNALTLKKYSKKKPTQATPTLDHIGTLSSGML